MRVQSGNFDVDFGNMMYALSVTNDMAAYVSARDFSLSTARPSFDPFLTSLTRLLCAVHSRSLRDEKFDQVLTLFDKDLSILLSFDLPNPYEADSKQLWAAHQMLLDRSTDAPPGATAGEWLLPERLELAVVWDSERDRRVRELFVKSKDPYVVGVVQRSAKRLAEESALGMSESELYVPLQTLPFTKSKR